MIASSRNCDGAGAALHQIPFVHADDERGFALDQVGNAQILLFERVFGIDQHDHDLGKRIASSASATESFSSFLDAALRRIPAVS
jgi:hypothetical protein